MSPASSGYTVIKVAIADAHAVMREGVRRALEEAGGFEIVGNAVDGRTTLALARTTDASMLTLELTMPGIHGIELIGLIKHEKPRLRILVLTNSSEEAYATRAFQAGASGFVGKTCARADFLAAANKVASGGVYVSLTMAERFAQSFNEVAVALPHERLSRRELDVLIRIASGESVMAIARMLSLSAKTISTYRKNIFEKTGMLNDAAIVRYAVRHELVEDDDDGSPMSR